MLGARGAAHGVVCASALAVPQLRKPNLSIHPTPTCDTTQQVSGGSASAGGASAPRAAASASPASSAATGGGGAGGGSAALAAYDNLLATTLATMVQHGQAVGGDVAKVTAVVANAYQKQRAILAVSERAKQPPMSELQALLQPVATEMMTAGKLADDRRSQAFQQLKVVAESLNGLGWLAYTGPASGMPAPPQHVADSWNAAEFYANKLMMALKGKDEPQMNWLKGLKVRGWGGRGRGGVRWGDAVA